MDTEQQDLKNLKEYSLDDAVLQNQQEESSQGSDIPFKKPTLLVGKIGRLPKKLQSVRTDNNENGPKTNTETDNTCKEDKVDITSIVKTVKEVPSASDTELLTDKPLPPKKCPAQQQTENSLVLPYKEPSWSGLPETSGKPYVFEVLKNGTIIETIDLMKKSFWVFGRLANCDICMQHPTISRYHAVLQYRDIPSENDPPGFYIYDLGSTHGTFLNGKNNKLKPKIYAPVRVGHMIRLGCSQRSYILTGPEDDQEEESELSVTELKQLRDLKIKEHEEKMRQAEFEREEKRKREEEKGVDWGMGDDADDEEALGENPFASTNNEELYLDDPKKALRGFFEREGLELEYDCNEQGMGQFLCKVELPLDDDMGRPIVAEVLHKGKKKEAVVQCALEACRILDRFGVLRQATHESKKRKAKNWEENDFYDSDEDTFLDRTGTIEKKREKRMKIKEPEKAETYESLMEKEKEVRALIADMETKLDKAQAKVEQNNSDANNEEDSLDSYMKGLSEDKLDRQTVSKLKLELANLRKSHANVIRLINITKPAELPSLVPTNTSASTSGISSKSKLPIFGKRRAIPVKFPAKPSSTQVPQVTSQDEVEEESDEDNENSEKDKKSLEGTSDKQVLDSNVPEPVTSSTNSGNNQDATSSNLTSEPSSSDVITSSTSLDDSKSQSQTTESSNVQQDDTGAMSDSDSSSDSSAPVQILGEFRPIKTFHDTETFRKFERIMKTGLPAVADKHKKKLEKILRRLQRLASNEDRMHSDWKILSAKKRKVMKWVEDLRTSQFDEKLEYRVSTEINRILDELNMMTEDKFKVIGQVKHMGHTLKSISMEIDKDIQELKKKVDPAEAHILLSQPSTSKDTHELEDRKKENQDLDDKKDSLSTETDQNEEAQEKSEENDEKRRKRNQKRNEQRQHKAELERLRGYEEDASREDYSMWVPPSDQSGDGRTGLNDKFGY